MTQRQLQKEQKRVINEIHKRSGMGELLKDKKISLLGDVLLCAQVLLEKIETGENSVFNGMIYTKTINFYFTQMKKYAEPNY